MQRAPSNIKYWTPNKWGVRNGIKIAHNHTVLYTNPQQQKHQNLMKQVKKYTINTSKNPCFYGT